MRVHLVVWSEDDRDWGPYLFIRCTRQEKQNTENQFPPVSAHIRGCRLHQTTTAAWLYSHYQVRENMAKPHSSTWIFDPTASFLPPLLLKEGQHNNVAAQSIHTTGYTPVELDQCKRTCGQYEGLRGSLGERGRGVVAVPAVWVKKVRGQMRSKVNYWPRRRAKRSAVIWRQKGKNVKCYIICLHIVTFFIQIFTGSIWCISCYHYFILGIREMSV